MLSRRNLLKGFSAAAVTAGAAVQGLLPVGLTAIAAPQPTEKVWKLSPRYPCSRVGHGADFEAKKPKCIACNACRAHAHNKFFATVRAARQNRAHVACNCVAFSIIVPRRRYRRLFGFPGCEGQGRQVFDRRVDTLYTRCTAP